MAASLDKVMKKVLVFVLLMWSTLTVAQQFAPPPPPPPPPPPGYVDAPPPPPAVQSGQVMEPGVTITQTEDETIYEYRHGSQLYMVRVVPKAGPPYYFYDMDGDGQLDIQSNDPRNSHVNQWVLFRW